MENKELKNNLELTEIKSFLTVFIGSNTNEERNIAKALCDFVNDKYNLQLSYSFSRYYKQIFYLDYIIKDSEGKWLQQYSIIRVSYKKKKGDYHHVWYSNTYYDWTFADFDIAICGGYESIEQAIEKVKEDYNKMQEQKNAKDNEAIEIVKHLMEHYNKPINDILDKIYYINDKRYTIQYKIEEENKQ